MRLNVSSSANSQRTGTAVRRAPSVSRTAPSSLVHNTIPFGCGSPDATPKPNGFERKRSSRSSPNARKDPNAAIVAAQPLVVRTARGFRRGLEPVSLPDMMVRALDVEGVSKGVHTVPSTASFSQGQLLALQTPGARLIAVRAGVYR